MRTLFVPTNVVVQDYAWFGLYDVCTSSKTLNIRVLFPKVIYSMVSHNFLAYNKNIEITGVLNISYNHTYR